MEICTIQMLFRNSSNIQLANNNFFLLDSLKTFTYFYDTTAYPFFGFSTAQQTGILSQELQNLFPELVKDMDFSEITDSAGIPLQTAVTIKAANYTGLIPFMLQYIRYQKLRIDTMQQSIDACCNLRPTGSVISPAHEITLTSDQAILYQNRPNPFDHSTVINYFIPVNTGKAKIIFKDETGRDINEITISEKGEGALKVNAGQLRSGIYAYSLIIDGKMIDSKKMLKAK